MWFWIWFGILGIVAGANYKRRTKPMMQKLAANRGRWATITCVVISIYCLMLGRHGNYPFFNYGITAAGVWFLLFLAQERFQLKAEAACQIKHEEMNRKVAEFYEVSKQQAKRESIVPLETIVPLKNTVPPPPLIQQYVEPEYTRGEFTSLATGEEVQQAYDTAVQKQATELVGNEHWAYQAEIAKRNLRHRLVTALRRCAQQMPEEGSSISPTPASLFSQRRPEMVPVKLLADRSQHGPVASTPKLQPPTPPVPPTLPTTSPTAIEDTTEAAGFKYQPKLVESRFGSANPSS